MARFDETEPINIEEIIVEKEKKPNKKTKKEKPIMETEEKEELKEEIKEEIEKIEDNQEKDFQETKAETIQKEGLTEEIPLRDIVKNDYQEQTIVNMDPIITNKIGIASDHRGYTMKQKLTKYLNDKGYTVVDYGGDGVSGDDYTEFGFKLGEGIKSKEVERGIAICGSGIGISIACNKVKKVRCAKVNNIKEAKWAKNDNNANVIAISAKMPLFRAKDIIDVFLKERFSGAERHQRRIDALDNYQG